jgi:hypothetical protein
MLDYSSFSTLNISVGKLLAGRYEIVSQLRSDPQSLELLVRDKIQDDEMRVLRLCAAESDSQNTDLLFGQFAYSIEVYDEESYRKPAVNTGTPEPKEEERLKVDFRKQSVILRAVFNAVKNGAA